MLEFYVYILLCADDSYYVGITNDFEERLEQHSLGLDPHSYTFARRPVKLVHLEIFSTAFEAIAREKQLKKWSRKKKEALIKKEYENLPDLSKSVFWNKKKMERAR